MPITTPPGPAPCTRGALSCSPFRKTTTSSPCCPRRTLEKAPDPFFSFFLFFFSFSLVKKSIMVVRSRFFMLYLLDAILLGIPSNICWFRDPFFITRHEYDFFLGLIPGGGVDVHPTVLILGKT